MARQTISGVPLPTIDPFKMALGGQPTAATNPFATAPNAAAGAFARATGKPPAPIAPVTPIAPPPPPIAPVTAITASSLAPQAVPQFPTVQTNTQPSTALGSSLAGIQAQALAIQKQIQEQNAANAGSAATGATGTTATGTTPPAPVSSRQSILDRILGLGNDLSEKGADTLAANKDAGVNEKAQQITDLTNQYNAKERFYQNKADEIRKNTAGRIDGGVEELLAINEREKNQELGNIAIQQAAATGNFKVAQDIAKQVVDSKYEPIQAQIDLLTKYYQLSANDLTESEKITVQEKIAEKQATVNFERSKEMADYEQNIRQNDPLYRANLSNVYSQIAERNANIADAAFTGNIDVNSLSSNGYSASQNNGAAITSLLKNGDVGTGTRTQLASVLGVINASEELANNNIEGKFEGINPFTGILSSKIFGIGLPFRETVKSDNQIANEGYIEAINLRSQIWASGASLTTEQINQVNRFTPRVSDTDKNVQAKLNNLTNFMLGQTKTQLQSEGVTFIPAKVDLFETAKMIKEASPEQRAELRARGLIK